MLPAQFRPFLVVATAAVTIDVNELAGLKQRIAGLAKVLDRPHRHSVRRDRVLVIQAPNDPHTPLKEPSGIVDAEQSPIDAIRIGSVGPGNPHVVP